MKGKASGRPIKWVYASVNEKFFVGKPGLVVEVWNKWSKKQRTKLGTLTVSVGGLRWAPSGGKPRRRDWDTVNAWFLRK
jgi:hypothetical protein